MSSLLERNNDSDLLFIELDRKIETVEDHNVGLLGEKVCPRRFKKLERPAPAAEMNKQTSASYRSQRQGRQTAKNQGKQQNQGFQLQGELRGDDKSKSEESHMISAKITKLVSKGAIVKYKPCEGQFISPISVMPQADKFPRLILNLKKLNEFIKTNHFKMESYKTVTGLIGRNADMANIDIKDAFYHVPMNESHGKFLRFQFQGEVYDLSLPTFTGKQDEWENFKQRFCSLVRNKESIPRVAKLQHLLNAVQGPAALRLRGLEIVESNFDVAWDMLLWRYDNQNIRMFNALEHLIGLPRVKVRCAEDLTDLIDRSEEAVRSLTELQCLVKFYDIWIVHCVVRKLDANSRES
uniref:Reverse transcriptase domain-containing protein n=1 Tax=Trichogramma kaykai TaxID=54128 RepID=A0ABD2W2B3_9HYME